MHCDSVVRRTSKLAAERSCKLARWVYSEVHVDVYIFRGLDVVPKTRHVRTRTPGKRDGLQMGEMDMFMGVLVPETTLRMMKQ